MTFRNPLTSLPAGQITPGTLGPGVLLPAPQVSAGTLALAVIAQGLADDSVTPAQLAPGAVTSDAIAANTIIAGKIAAGAVGANELAANAITSKTITGGTITGAVLQTAATGRRVIISSATSGRIDFKSGDAQESSGGGLDVGIIPGDSSSTKDAGYMSWQPPQLGSSVVLPATSLLAIGQSRDGTDHGGWQMVGDLNLDGTLTLAGKALGSDTGWVTTGVIWGAGWHPPVGIVGDFRPLAYRLRDDELTINGAVTADAAFAAGATILTMPPGLAPTGHFVSSHGDLKTDVLTSGAFRTVTAGGAGTYGIQLVYLLG